MNYSLSFKVSNMYIGLYNKRLQVSQFVCRQCTLFTLSKKSSWTLIKVQFSQKCFILGKLLGLLCEAGECPLHFDTELEGIG